MTCGHAFARPNCPAPNHFSLKSSQTGLSFTISAVFFARPPLQLFLPRDRFRRIGKALKPDKPIAVVCRRESFVNLQLVLKYLLAKIARLPYIKGPTLARHDVCVAEPLIHRDHLKPLYLAPAGTRPPSNGSHPERSVLGARVRATNRGKRSRGTCFCFLLAG